MQCTICLKSLHSFLLSTEMKAKYAFVIHFKTTTVLVAKCDSSGTWWGMYLFWVTYDVRTKNINAIWGWLILLKTSDDVKSFTQNVYLCIKEYVPGICSNVLHCLSMVFHKHYMYYTTREEHYDFGRSSLLVLTQSAQLLPLSSAILNGLKRHKKFNKNKSSDQS